MPGDNDATFRVGLLGPSRVGKTSLVTALLGETQKLLAGSGVAIRPVGRDTEDKVAGNRQELEGSILSGEFASVGLLGTMEPFTFRLRLDAGVPGAGLHVQLLDFPGGWLRPDRRPSEADWTSCRDFITQSTILLIPVDATLLMEATQARHWQTVTRLLTTAAVEDVARDWAIERNRRPAEPALLAFCPVKCESYFSDNGGLRNCSAELARRFHDTYAGVINAVRAEAPQAGVLYAPVDTIGCVELTDARWPAGANGETEFKASYRIRAPGRISRAGVDDLMRAICRQLVQGRRLLDARDGELLGDRADQAREYATRDEGFFRDIWMMGRGERAARRLAAQSSREDAEEAGRRVSALDSVLKQIAGGRLGPRADNL